MDRFADLLEGAAAANIGDRGIDICVGGLRLVLKERCHRHDHAALTVPALRNVVFDPSLLHAVLVAVLGKAFDGGDLLPDCLAHLRGTGARRHAVDVHGAGATLRNAAAILGAGETDVFPDHPEQRGVRFDIDVNGFSIDVETHHNLPPFSALWPLFYAPLKLREP